MPSTEVFMEQQCATKAAPSFKVLEPREMTRLFGGCAQGLGYNIPPPLYYKKLFSAAQRSDVVAMMPWELVPWHVAAADSGGYDFGIDDVSFGPISDAIAYQKARVGSLYHAPWSTNPGRPITDDLHKVFI